MSSSFDIGHHLLGEIATRFRETKRLAEGALVQASDDDFFRTLDHETNSLAVVVQHVAGNLRSRFTDFLTTDGEKPDRHRDAEFEVAAGTPREALMDRWEEGWGILFATLATLAPNDLGRTVEIRHQPHTVIEALERSLTHMAYHVGQIVFLTKHYCAERWRTLSVPRGGTEQFNRSMREQFSAQDARTSKEGVGN
jgi:Protein of unknown function (DUF1572)